MAKSSGIATTYDQSTTTCQQAVGRRGGPVSRAASNRLQAVSIQTATIVGSASLSGKGSGNGVRNRFSVFGRPGGRRVDARTEKESAVQQCWVERNGPPILFGGMIEDASLTQHESPRCRSANLSGRTLPSMVPQRGTDHPSSAIATRRRSRKRTNSVAAIEPQRGDQSIARGANPWDLVIPTNAQAPTGRQPAGPHGKPSDTLRSD